MHLVEVRFGHQRVGARLFQPVVVVLLQCLVLARQPEPLAVALDVALLLHEFGRLFRRRQNQ